PGLRGRAQAGAQQRRPAHDGGLGGAAPGPLGGGAPASGQGGRARPPFRQHGAAHCVLVLYLRRYPEAQVALDRALALGPTNLTSIEDKAMVALGQRDLARARAVVRTALTAVEPAALLAIFGNYWDLYWVLDDSQQQQLLALPPSAWDHD